MHLGLKQLADFVATHRDDEHLVQATVVDTAGSTYRKTGAMMLLAADGGHAGLISGGCLEADLVGHARPVFRDGQPRRLSYDLHDDEELALSLGLGCGGDVHLLLQRLDREDGFGALGAGLQAVSQRRRAWLGLVLDGPEPGRQALRDEEGHTWGDPDVMAVLPVDAVDDRPGHRARSAQVGDSRALLIGLAPPPRVLVCGAGPDAVPVAAQVTLLGWEAWVVDHRAAHARPDRFAHGVRVIHARPEQLSERVDLDDVAAAVVMSHHVGHDETYLRQLAKHSPAYLGLLGPARRREDICARAGIDPSRVRGPVGLDIGAELPESIALSIMAEVHAVLNRRSARSLAADA